MERQILHIDLDSFFVSVEQVQNPDLLGKPVVVGGHPDSRGVVACASYEARKFGLHAGMPISAARRLCPQTIFLPGNFSLYRDFSARFMDILADFSPDLEPGGLDEAFLDLTGFEPLYGPTRETAHRIKSRIKEELEITASIGVATCKVVAKVASDFSKPDGLVEVAAGQEMSFLAPLPIKDLPGVGPKMQEALKRFGVSTIGQLAKLPVSLLKDQFGIHGEMIRRHANGIDDRKVKRYDAVKSISRETTLEQDTLDLHLLKATLKHLTERIGADLRLQERQARCVTLKLRYSDFDTITRSQTQKQPTDLDQVIFNVGSELLDNCLSQRRHAVRLIGIGISNLTGPEKQLNLIDTSSQKLAYLDQAIDQIRKKYGFSAIQTGQTLPLKDKHEEIR